MNPASLPCARELFRQWQRARGERPEPAARPFSRGWEDLLEEARLVSATDRSEAERDARMLETGGWVELKPVRYKLHLIARIVIPLVQGLWNNVTFGSPVAPTPGVPLPQVSPPTGPIAGQSRGNTGTIPPHRLALVMDCY